MTGSTERPSFLTAAAVVAGAFVLSLGLIWFATGSAVAVAAYGSGTVMIGLIVWLLLRSRPDTSPVEPLSPDWAVTAVALEQDDAAIAIMDRANRLVCASSTYEDWFGGIDAPTALMLADEGRLALAGASREAWREGEAQVPRLAMQESSWRVEVRRAGRAEDYLVWKLVPLREPDPTDIMAVQIAGGFGTLLSRAGIETAVVDPDGVIRAASAGFARRTMGDPTATMAGQDFASQLRVDDRDCIFFARETRRGRPHTLVQVPLGDPTGPAASAAQVPSLMLLMEDGIGLGGRNEPPAAAGAPQLEGLLSQLPLGLAMADSDGRLLFANAAFARAGGIEGRDLPPYPSDLVIKEDKAALVDAVRRFGKGPASSGDMAVRLRGNPDEPVSLGLAGVRGLGEASVLLSLTDSTEETRLKRQVAQATKMQAVGQLAGGVAHDFNNVLTAIIGYCDLMLLRHTPGDSDYDDIQQIRANSNRAASLTRQLLAFSRQQTLRPEVLQLPDIVSEVSQLLKRLVGEKIEFRVDHARGLGPVRADPQQLEQVIVNLAVNARDAMQTRNGTRQLSLSTRKITPDHVRRMKSEIVPIGEYTALVVEDTGGGIPAEHLGKIFEPFFTTKETGRGGNLGGTGLGLSTVYGIVKQSGGFIFAENAEGADGKPVGARFTIFLPVHHVEPGAAQEEPARNPASAEAPSQWSGGGRILLVEDEDMVRAVAERALTREGYTVVAAADGEEGLDIVKGGERFDLVLSDVVMPGMDGPAMARAMRGIAPDTPVLFMSGYAEEQLRKAIDIDNVHFIAKPFSVQQIAGKVAEVLGAVQA